MGVKSAFFAQTFLPVKIFLPAQAGKSFLPVNRFTGNEIGSLSPTRAEQAWPGITIRIRVPPGPPRSHKAWPGIISWQSVPPGPTMYDLVSPGLTRHY